MLALSSSDFPVVCAPGRFERYMDVESFWKSTTVEQRRELLRVPMSSLLHGTALAACGHCEFEG